MLNLIINNAAQAAATTAESVYISDSVNIEKARHPASPVAYAVDPVTGERWATIQEYANSHVVSDQGRVRSLPRTVKSNGGGSYELPGKDIKARLHTGGQLIVSLSKNGKCRMLTVRQLVAKAFVEGGPGPLGKMQVRHIDGDPRNCKADNLEWVPSKKYSSKK